MLNRILKKDLRESGQSTDCVVFCRKFIFVTHFKVKMEPPAQDSCKLKMVFNVQDLYLGQ